MGKKRREPEPADLSFEDKLRAVIASSGKSQSAYAAELGIHVRTLRGWLYGNRPPPAVAVKLIDCLYKAAGK